MTSKKTARPFKARVTVMPRRAVLDPQGKAIEQALGRLGHDGVSDVRAGKSFELRVAAADQAAADVKVREMAEGLLANPVMEDWTVHVEADDPAAEETGT